MYTKAAALRLLPFATKIEAIREFKNCIQVTYRANGGRCSTFLSKTAFLADHTSLRKQGSVEVEVTEVHGGEYVVKSKSNYYTVRPGQLDPRDRCECGDCHWRGAKCKHQIAVEQFRVERGVRAA
ncbi:hypothetical protein JYQ62_19740 [Nostoc sp. UHCC 0702]|nr:hypothetical protein JYQ62_19740 [Nostoc sp. UHCC 0702]